MDRLFAEDEMNSADLFKTSPIIEKPKKNATYFSSAAFWRKTNESVKVGVILSNLDGKLWFLLCDSSKKIVEKLEVDEMRVEFDEKELAFRFLKETVKFVDNLTFLRFAVLFLIHSRRHPVIRLLEGSGDVEITENAEIRCNITSYSLDEDGELRLPDERRGVKTRMSREKCEEHFMYKWLKNARKGCHFLIKSKENSVLEVIVDKVRQTVDSESDTSKAESISAASAAPGASPEAPPTSEAAPEAPEAPEPSLAAPEASPAAISAPGSSPASLVAPEASILAPPTPEPRPSPDLRDTIHRILGIELDRIEMRLNHRINQFQAEVTARLDRQTDLLQQVLNKCDK
uniref:DUF3699 domain-containing protein n=1 Tax=Caenorhabditis tropicalis TaxID=1561998 RepID=A0A1I7TF59_9PELO